MRVALCLSGQPRFIKEVAPYILENVCQNYHVDTFFHFWFDDDLQNKPYKYGGNGGWEHQRISNTAISDAINLYQPKLYKVEQSKRFVDSALKTDYCYRNNGELIAWTKHWKECMEPDYRNRMVNNWISSHYSLNQVGLLKKEYEYANNFRYDYVLRCRSDCIIKNKIIFENYDRNKIHYTNTFRQPDNMIWDGMNFGNSKNMDILMSIFPIIDFVMEKCMRDLNGAWCNEMLYKTILDFFNIQYQEQSILVDVPRF